jgi:hypothetical protein
LPPTRSSAADDNFQKGVNKIQNLDFKATKESLKMSNLEDAQKTQEQKNKAAASYRANLLKEQQQKSATQAPELSPGYRREKATDRHAKKQKADRKAASGAAQLQGSNKHVDTSKATVLQCVFNFSNILMVRCAGFVALRAWGGSLNQ